jgi:hypothetical protein
MPDWSFEVGIIFHAIEGNPAGARAVIDDPPGHSCELFAIRSTPCIWRTSDDRLRIPIEPTSERHQ